MRKQLIWYLVLFAVLDLFVPVPIVALILAWVLWKRPPWFLGWVRDVYAGHGFDS